MVIRAYLLAGCAVLPLIAPRVYSGLGVALSDPILGVVSADEQPLSVRSNGALWAMGLVLVWSGLAYSTRRRVSVWDAALVVVGGAAALARAGNLWLLGLALVVPLARQLAGVPRVAALPTAAMSLAIAIAAASASRSPSLPPVALAAVLAQPSSATVLADWRWASDLQRHLGDRAHVLAADGVRAQPTSFWLDYLRVTQGYERWSEVLRTHAVNVVVLNTADEALTAELVRASPEWRVLSDADGALVAELITSPAGRGRAKRG